MGKTCTAMVILATKGTPRSLTSLDIAPCGLGENAVAAGAQDSTHPIS
jgi:hypothetical protein